MSPHPPSTSCSRDSPLPASTAMSAYYSMATKARTFQIGSFVPIGDIAIRLRTSISVYQSVKLDSNRRSYARAHGGRRKPSARTSCDHCPKGLDREKLAPPIAFDIPSNDASASSEIASLPRWTLDSPTPVSMARAMPSKAWSASQISLTALVQGIVRPSALAVFRLKSRST
jgi:hypothetical protein